MGAYDELFKRYCKGWYCAPPPPDGDDGDNGGGEGDGDHLSHLSNELDADDRKILGLDGDGDGTSDTGDGGAEGDGDAGDGGGTGDDGTGDGDEGGDSGSDSGDGDFDYKAGYEQLKADMEELKNSSSDGKGKDDSGSSESDSGSGDPVKAGELTVSEIRDDNPLSKYNGMKFGDIYSANPNDAWAISPRHAQEHMLDLRDEARDAESKQKEHDEWVKQELDNFSDKRSEELHGKKFADLSDTEKHAIMDIQDKVLKWMDKTGRGRDSIEDGYWLMEKDNIIARAKAGGAKDIVDKASDKSGAVRVKAGGGNGSGEGVDGTWKSLVSASAAQVEDHIDSLSESDYAKFMKDAPAEFRKKYPALPYN